MSQTKLLFTGESAYQVHEALSYWKDNFVSKYGREGLHIFRHDELDVGQIQSALMGGGFFATKSLVVIYGIPRDNITTNSAKAAEAQPVEDLLQKHREQIPQDNILILVSYKPDKRTKSYKFFSKHAELKEFKPKKPKDLVPFVLSRATNLQDESKSLISTAQAQMIIASVGPNMYNLAYESQKLQYYAQYHQLEMLSDEQIQSLIYSQSEGDNFKILDSIVTDPSKVIPLIDEARDDGTDIFQFLGMLYRGLKIILGVCELHDAGVTSSKEVASTLKVHPFAASKQRSKVQTFQSKRTDIEGLYLSLLHMDRDIKTGRFPAEGAWVQIKSLISKIE